MDEEFLAYKEGFQTGYLAAFHACLQMLPRSMHAGAALRAAAALSTHAVQIQAAAESAGASTNIEAHIINPPEEEGEPEGEEEMEKQGEEEEEEKEEEEKEGEGSDTDTSVPAPKRRRLSGPSTTGAHVAPSAVDAASLILAVISNLHTAEHGSNTNL